MDLRYPVGKFALDNDITPDKRRGWIRQLDTLPGDVRNALAELPPGGLDTPYRDGGWTPRQVVHHLADSHSNAYTRIKLALTEDTPALKTYEEQLWAEMPDGKTADVAPSLAILDGIHTRLTIVLESLTPDQFGRTAMHPQWGQMTVDVLVQLYAWHCRHHVAHIGLVRSRSGVAAR
ncbi:MAG TPA: putative metal-dependent hydrolase [Vicinamibacterales bacterium]|nr:putative metal-dependent hydrolase [Vicinamibacterales bacterium]